MNYPHCKICGHLEQNHEYDKLCLHCSFLINLNSNEKMTGYCGNDNLKYLEKKNEVKK
jgi:hypothetical protein